MSRKPHSRFILEVGGMKAYATGLNPFHHGKPSAVVMNVWLKQKGPDALSTCFSHNHGNYNM